MAFPHMCCGVCHVLEMKYIPQNMLTVIIGFKLGNFFNDNVLI